MFYFFYSFIVDSSDGEVGRGRGDGGPMMVMVYIESVYESLTKRPSIKPFNEKAYNKKNIKNILTAIMKGKI